jgi:hypothetical protein
MESQHDISASAGAQVRSKKDFALTSGGKKDALARRWIQEIKTTQRRLKQYYDRVDKVVARYRARS